MLIVLVNNNITEMESFSTRIKQEIPNCTCLLFADPFLSVKYIMNNPVDMVFVEAKMQRLNGIELLRNIRRYSPDLPVVILAEDNKMRERAKKLAVDGYWQKREAEGQIKKIIEMIKRKD